MQGSVSLLSGQGSPVTFQMADDPLYRPSRSCPAVVDLKHQ